MNLVMIGVRKVSIPSRGSGKGDGSARQTTNEITGTFQSPLGEVVKETLPFTLANSLQALSRFQSPLGEVVKETYSF